MFHDIIFLLLGLAFLLAGANYLTDGATVVARRFKMSDLMIGMTVVAFGSSTPDLVISLTSTLRNEASMAVGDILGANIFDILLVIGVCAMVRKVVIGKELLQKEFPMIVLSSVVFALVACDVLIDRLPANFIDRSDGLILLCFFAINIYITYKIAKAPDTEPSAAGNNQVSKKPTPMWLAIVMIGGGLAGLVIGGNWMVSSASAIALKCGMSSALVGLTIVGIGSSLPDLSTSLIATLKGHSGIAVGNIVGACVLNVFFIIGTCATVKPMELGTIEAVDFGVLVGGSILLFVFGKYWGSRIITRWEGAVLVACYAGYIVYLIIHSN